MLEGLQHFQQQIETCCSSTQSHTHRKIECDCWLHAVVCHMQRFRLGRTCGAARVWHMRHSHHHHEEGRSCSVQTTHAPSPDRHRCPMPQVLPASTQHDHTAISWLVRTVTVTSWQSHQHGTAPVSAMLRSVCRNAQTMESMTSLSWSGDMVNRVLKQWLVMARNRLKN